MTQWDVFEGLDDPPGHKYHKMPCGGQTGRESQSLSDCDTPPTLGTAMEECATAWHCRR
jgi:hypothetical protein